MHEHKTICRYIEFLTHRHKIAFLFVSPDENLVFNHGEYSYSIPIKDLRPEKKKRDECVKHISEDLAVESGVIETAIFFLETVNELM
jgi:hypothetical protein